MRTHFSELPPSHFAVVNTEVSVVARFVLCFGVWLVGWGFLFG